MRVALIALGVVAVSSLFALIYAYFTARRGYQDEAGFHEGVQAATRIPALIRWVRMHTTRGKTQRAA